MLERRAERLPNRRATGIHSPRGDVAERLKALVC